MKKVLFVAGDPSGDAHAARVAAEVKARGATVWAAGGEALRGVADRWLGDIVSQGVMGFFEPIKKVPFFWKFLNRVLRPALENDGPDVVVPTDFFGFNRHVARVTKRAGRRVCYFIGPQLWASRPGRIRAIQKSVNRMLVIFPFEEKLYREGGVPVTFVGHPLMDVIPRVPDHVSRNVEPVVGLLPGSRRGEVDRILPIFFNAAARCPIGTRFVLFAAPTLANTYYDGLLSRAPLARHMLEVVRDENFVWRRRLDMALACSGTATLENALLGIPTMVAYRTSALTYGLARAMIRVDHIAMPNLLAGREVMPEFIQARATAENLSEGLTNLWSDRARWQTRRAELLAIRNRLGGPGASVRAAESILEEAEKGAG